MKYTLVYREHPQGYCWTIRNNQGLYAAAERGVPGNGKYTVRSWRSALAADTYLQMHIDSTCIWKPWPDEKPASIKPVTSASGYKPAHGGYPGSSAPRCVGQEIDRMAAGWANMGSVSGRTSSSQPLVWPVLPQADDGSNEEASTLPDVVIAVAMARAHGYSPFDLSIITRFPNL